MKAVVGIDSIRLYDIDRAQQTRCCATSKAALSIL